MKTVLIVATIFLVEAAVIVGIFMLSGGPRAVQGDPARADPRVMMDRPQEMLVIEGRFENNRWGRSYQFDMKIFITLKQKNLAPTQERVERMQAQLRSDIRTIIAQAEPAHLMEPSKMSITRQIHQQLDERLGRDEDGDPIVMDVMIPHWVRFKTDM
ncbi:MAG: hypothetical protein JJU36_17530 [Phycisphaeraceae bacterium]|nr:hypothetical protein [Phycisphaeraceae bacterium]